MTEEVSLSLAILNPKDGKPNVETALVLLPAGQRDAQVRGVSRRGSVHRGARQGRRGDGRAAPPRRSGRRALRFLCESMRDAADARKVLRRERQGKRLRDVIIAEQIRLFLSE